MTEKMFPILIDYSEKYPQLRSIPWAMLEPHRQRVTLNHNQTLERLAQRGGLCEAEVLLILDDKKLFWKTNLRDAIVSARDGELTRRVEAWKGLRIE